MSNRARAREKEARLAAAGMVQPKQRGKGIGKRVGGKVKANGVNGAQKPAVGAVQPSKGATEVKGAMLTRRQEIRLVTTGYCLCGCGHATNPRRLFIQGHDAKAKSLILRHTRGEVALDDLPQAIRTLLPSLAICSCCKSPIWLGKSECDHKTCNCQIRAEIAKRKKMKVQVKDEDEEDELDDEEEPIDLPSKPAATPATPATVGEAANAYLKSLTESDVVALMNS